MQNPPSSVTVGRRIARARKRARVTQQQLADALGVKRPTMCAIELGQRRTTPADIALVARACGVTSGEILSPVTLVGVLRHAHEEGLIADRDIALFVYDGDLSEGQGASILGNRIALRSLMSEIDGDSW